MTFTEEELEEMIKDLSVMKRPKSRNYSKYHEINNIHHNQAIEMCQARLRIIIREKKNEKED